MPVIVDKEPDYVSGDLSGYDTYHKTEPFVLSSGEELPELTVAYETWGELNSRRDNAILLQCGMSASSHARSHPLNTARGWWEDYIGPGRPLDTNIFFVICTNNLGGCYGSTGPSSIDPRQTGNRRYGGSFPRFDLRDMVAAQFALLDHLGIERVHAVVGASLGGMLSLCSAAMFPDRVGKFVSISACAKSFPGSIAFRHVQRQAIMSDPNWNGGDYYDGPLPAAGLQLARQVGTITYRSGQEWQHRFGQKRRLSKLPDGCGHAPRQMANEFEIEHYLAYQGVKWVNNYDPNSMLWISKAMDSFTLEKPDSTGTLSLVAGLKEAMQPALVIGVQHDCLFPVWQQKEIADSLKAAGNADVAYYELDSTYGHDTFLLEARTIGPAVKGHLEQEPGGAQPFWEDVASSASRILQAVAARSSSADHMRDIFRALAASSQAVETERLRSVTKIAWRGRVSEETVDRIFKQHLPNTEVTMGEFMAIREALLKGESESEYEVYLP